MSPVPRDFTYDAVVVGSGPNGLAGAITLARAGFHVLVLEGAATIGGGARSDAGTLPGFVHDVCSSLYPMAMASPFIRSLPLAEHGLRWIHAPAPLAHPLDHEPAVVLERSIDATAQGVGPDATAYAGLMQPIADGWETLAEDILAPPHFPRHPAQLARFGWSGLRSARGLAESRFQGPRARALFAGLAAHAVLPLADAGTAAFGLVLGGFGHAVGWPLVAGGAQRLSDALGSYFRSLGGEIRTGITVGALGDLPKARVTLLDLGPRQFNALTSAHPSPKRARLEAFRYGPGVFKIDWALDGPVPWRDAACARAATVHLGGTLEEIATGEAAIDRGEAPDRPFVLLAQTSLFDPNRAPPGQHTAWAYCHVPAGWTGDRLAAIEAQVERFAPGFRDRVLGRRSLSPAQLERYNPNYVGGDLGGGRNDLRQLFTRPLLQRVPYATGLPGVYLCSASTPPGGGVHGMCGFHAASAALRRELRR